MAAVNFLKFATAIMELLEPTTSAEVTATSVEGQNNQLILITAVTANTSVAQTFSTLGQSQEKAVEAAAANLTNAITQASDEKVAQVAQAIQEFAAESNSIQSSSAISQTISQIASVNSPLDAALIVQTTVKTLAAETVEQIKEAKGSSQLSEQPSKTIGSEKVEITDQITTALTEKIQEKTAEASTDHYVQFSTATPAVSNFEPEQRVEDFWEHIKEIDPSRITYQHAVSYLYQFMTDRSLLDILNPKIDYSQRVVMVTDVMNSAIDVSTIEIGINYSSQNHNYARTELLRNGEQSSIIEQESKEKETQRQAQLLNQQRAEQQELTDRLSSQRLRQNLKS